MGPDRLVGGSNFCCTCQVGSAIFGFNFLRFGSKKISLGWIKKYPGQSRVGLLFTAGQMYAWVRAHLYLEVPVGVRTEDSQTKFELLFVRVRTYWQHNCNRSMLSFQVFIFPSLHNILMLHHR